MRFTLRHRVLVILAGFVLISFLLGLVLVWYTFRIEGLIASITEKDLSAFHQAEALENTLMKQKGLVSYFILDGNSGWLNQQEGLRQAFLDQLARIRAASETAIQTQILDEIEAEFAHYTTKKDNVVELFRSGNPADGAVEHFDAHVHFESLMRLCERFKQFHTDRIQSAKADSHSQAQRLRVLALAAIFISAGLTLLLAFVFVYQILEPLRRLTLEADRSGEPARTENEVKTLSRRVRVLLHNVDHTQSELEKSRESLAQAEKMALVGKLAASMAHSIRNPFTSVQMRLFSLSRSLDLDDVQKEDLEVISSEIRHIDTIVQNFLEFSRPPKLKMQDSSPSSVVDAALRLLRYRLKSYDVTVTVNRPIPLPTARIDTEQLREVAVNLIVNACEAMPPGGSIAIEERTESHPHLGPAAVIVVRDNGPGIPAHLREKIFQPFFSTKEQGTGLGLSIAQRIITEHGGRLEVESTEGHGAAFIIILPCQEPIHHEPDPDH
jgi:signal transduction histidine kinase